MKESCDQLIIEYSKTDKESISVRLVCVFLVLVFAFIPLAEIVADFDYNNIVHSNPRIFCGMDVINSYESLSFKTLY